MSEINCSNKGFIFVKKDKKRLKAIKSFDDDIEAHYKIIRGIIFEIKRPDNYGGRVGDFLTSVNIGDKSIFFYKNRFKITKPPSKGTSDGYRIIFGILELEENNFLYIPILVFIAKEEGSSIEVNLKKFKLTSTNFKKIISERISDL